MRHNSPQLCTLLEDLVDPQPVGYSGWGPVTQGRLLVVNETGGAARENMEWDVLGPFNNEEEHHDATLRYGHQGPLWVVELIRKRERFLFSKLLRVKDR